MSSKKKSIVTYLGKVVFITLLIVLFIRTFLFEPYRVSSPQMETFLLEGDQILVDKTAYGIRLPMTILSIPFTFDKIFGQQSYSTQIEASYKRFFEKAVKRNDVVLFNNPSEKHKPLDKRSLLLSRCIALPGDTVQAIDGKFYVGKNQFVDPPDLIEEYAIKRTNIKDLKSIVNELEIPLRDFRKQGDTTFLKLSKLEAFLLSESLPEAIDLSSIVDTTKNYKFLVPFKGKLIDIDAQNLVVYKQVILLEQGDKAIIENDVLMINNKRENSYTFEDDYYWLLSDNGTNSLDSRSLGFIPFKNIIGKANFIWYSSTNDGTPRWNRCFSRINY